MMSESEQQGQLNAAGGWAEMTPDKLKEELAFRRIEAFLSEHIDYTKQNNLEVYPPSYICKYHPDLVSKAMHGDHLVRDILCDLASALTAHGKSLPPWLQEYVVWAVRHGGFSHRKRGRDPHANRHRNDTIAMAVFFLTEDGFHPTRNAATSRESGCSLVAKALAGIGIHMSEANVAAIWRDDWCARACSSEERREAMPATQCSCTLGDCQGFKRFGPRFDDRIAAIARSSELIGAAASASHRAVVGLGQARHVQWWST